MPRQEIFVRGDWPVFLKERPQWSELHGWPATFLLQETIFFSGVLVYYFDGLPLTDSFDWICLFLLVLGWTIGWDPAGHPRSLFADGMRQEILIKQDYCTIQSPPKEKDEVHG